MKYAIIFVFTIFTQYNLWCQSVSDQSYFSISYFGILGTHPGVKFGFQKPLATINRTQTNTNLNEIIAATNVIIYFHRRNHLGWGLNLEIGYRNKKFEKTNKEVMFGIGYLRSLLPNPVYEFNPDNTFSRKKFSGTNHLLKTVSLGLGANKGENINSNFWLLKPTLLHLRPFNTKSTVNFALDVGYHFQ